jgi:hypothetical protein
MYIMNIHKIITAELFTLDPRLVCAPHMFVTLCTLFEPKLFDLYGCYLHKANDASNNFQVARLAGY